MKKSVKSCGSHSWVTYLSYCSLLEVTVPVIQMWKDVGKQVGVSVCEWLNPVRLPETVPIAVSREAIYLKTS